MDALWLSPIFPSPMADFGYDVSDYTNIDPRFGTMADFDALVAAAHARGLRVLLDYVPNHTSNQHPWFLESRKSRDNPKRDWYVWRDPGPRGGPPNNWVAVFGGPAWTLDKATGQYYYHAFLKEQPDLNWRNPDVQKTMFDVIRFWLGRGVDGFRVDTIWLLLEDDQLRDNPVNPNFRPDMLPAFALTWTHTADQPDTHALVRRMRQVFDEFPNRVLVAELLGSLTRLVSYYGATCDETQLPFNFQLFDATWEAPKLADLIAKYEAALPGVRVAGLGARQSRPAPRRHAPRSGSRARRDDAAPDAPRDADDLLRRRARACPTRSCRSGARAGSAREAAARPRPRTRSRAQPDAVGRERERRLHLRPPVAAARVGLADAQRQHRIERPGFRARAPSPVARATSRGADARRGLVRWHCRRRDPCSDTRDGWPANPRYLVALNLSDAPAEFSPEGVEIAGTIAVGTNRARDGERAVATGPPGCTRRDRRSLGPVTASSRPLTARAIVTPPPKQSRPRRARWDAALPAAASPRPTRRTRTARRPRREFAAAVSARLRPRGSAAARR